MSYPPAFSSFLGTNYVPSPTEVIQLKAQVQDWDQVIADLDRDLNALQQVQQHLSRQRERCVLSKKKYEALLEPMRRVPDEILAAVFLECLQQEPEGWAAMTPTEGTKHPAVTLTHVCRRWRNLAVGTPRLWAQVDLRVPSRPNSRRTIPRLTHLVRVSTQRSGACPMTIKIKVDTGESVPMMYGWGNTDGYEAVLKELVDEVCISSERWRSLSLSAILDPERGNLPLLQFFTAIANPLPALTQVHFEVSFETQDSRLRSICPKVLNGPALRSVSIIKPSGQLSSHGFNIHRPWAGVRNDGVAPEMANFGVTSLVALELLKSLPSLVHFDVDIDHAARDGEEELVLAAAAEPTQLPFLQSLSLKGFAVSPGFATSLTLPSLQSMSFTAIKLWSTEKQEAGIFECLSRFGDNITTFELDMARFSKAFILACAQSLTHVTTLKIGDSRAFDLDRNLMPDDGFEILLGRTPEVDITTLKSFIRHLTPRSHEQTPSSSRTTQSGFRAPNLQELILWWRNADHGLGLHMMDFISGRFASGRGGHGSPRLKRVVLRFPTQRLLGSFLDMRPELTLRGVDFGILKLEIEGLIPATRLPAHRRFDLQSNPFMQSLGYPTFNTAQFTHLTPRHDQLFGFNIPAAQMYPLSPGFDMEAFDQGPFSE
ncbi:hypothetical protein D9611_008274 [Ephemerocybe angulata]|uniref:F-box domain-containing protein n=1 Tax=Ephemerocybe angulata TaxID=980116 RepID=A0A8H5BIP4_9AGAR|nr:hypothetical protein D9611_008274 [Tulosesus angulatus]